MPTLEHQIRMKQYRHDWHQANKERRRIAARIRRSSNLELAHKREREQRQKHPESFKRAWKKYSSKPGYKEYNRLRGLAWRAKNRKSYNEKAAKRREANREVLRIRNREQYSKNPDLWKAHAAKRRALKQQATINLQGILKWQKRIRSRPFFTCFWCNRRYSIVNLHFDHVVALAKGGPHSVENLCTSCAQCNLSKNRRSVSEWFKAGQLILGI